MRIIVVSDTHGNVKALEAVYHAQPNADIYLHLGDGCGDVSAIRDKYPHINLQTVKGNTDFASAEAPTKFLATPQGPLVYTHGHTFYVKSGLDAYINYAKQVRVKIALFGHTHQPYYDVINGIHFLNPGNADDACSCRFGILDISDSGIVCVLSAIPR